jgi:hypothetical protein
MDGLSADINGLRHRLTRHAQARDDDRAGRHSSRHRRRDAAIDRAGDESRQRAPLGIAAIALAAVRPCAAGARAAAACAAAGSTITTACSTAGSAVTATTSAPAAIAATAAISAGAAAAIPPTAASATAAITATGAATIPAPIAATVPTPIATSSATAFGEGVVRSEIGSSGRQRDKEGEGRSRCQEHTGDGHRRASCDVVRFAKANMLRRSSGECRADPIPFGIATCTTTHLADELFQGSASVRFAAISSAVSQAR